MKLWLLRLASLFGLFRLAQALSRHKLRILCYHGISLEDEHQFKPGLFMQPANFAKRLDWLQRSRFKVVSLSDGLETMHQGKLSEPCVAITIDDGWYGSFSHMATELNRRGFPATLYLSTYYVEKQTQVFNVAVSYIFWKCAGGRLDLAELGLDSPAVFDLSTSAHKAQAAAEIIRHADELPDAASRQSLLVLIGETLAVDVRDLSRQRKFAFMTAQEAAALPEMDIDVQLHTHRHRFPQNDFALARQEIEQNRSQLREAGLSGPFTEFCYPSGEYAEHQLAWLRELGIGSATTTKTGLASASDDLLQLPRLLDADNLSELEFEAEISGFKDLLRGLLGRR